MTEKQKRFCEEYLIDLNATQAAIRAGYSPKSADEIGRQLLGKTGVSAEIQRELAKRSKRTGVTQDRVIRELAKIAFANSKDIIDPETGKIKPGITADDMAAVAGIKVKMSESDHGSSEEREVKLADKTKALELLGRHLGMWNDKLAVTMEPVTMSDDLKDD